MILAAAKVARLETQREFLYSKAKDMLCCRLKSLDKLDKVEEREK